MKVGKPIMFRLTADERAALEAHRRVRGLRSLNEAVRDLVENAWRTVRSLETDGDIA